MSTENNNQDIIVEELQEIKGLLQDILLIQGARAGLTKAKVREMLGVASSRVSSVWQHLDFNDD